MGRPSQVQSADVIRFGMPRKDLHVTLGDVTVKPGLALGSWTAFMRTGDGAMVMGDLVLTEDEVGPVMRRLQESGIKITAIHNHLISESPHVVSMHIEGHRDAVKMAEAIHEALGLTKTPGFGERPVIRTPGHRSEGHRRYSRPQREGERWSSAVWRAAGHMLTEEPRLFFMHFWANDDAARLAKGLKAALDQTNSKK